MKCRMRKKAEKYKLQAYFNKKLFGMKLRNQIGLKYGNGKLSNCNVSCDLVWIIEIESVAIGNYREDKFEIAVLYRDLFKLEIFQYSM